MDCKNVTQLLLKLRVLKDMMENWKGIKCVQFILSVNYNQWRYWIYQMNFFKYVFTSSKILNISVSLFYFFK